MNAIAPAAEIRAERLLERLARWLACFGGLVLAAIAVLTVVSIFGRALVFAGLGPIPGDFELVEMGCAVAVFSFLPWCQLNRGHVTVDIFVSWVSQGLMRVTSLAGDLVISSIAFILAWRMALGLMEKVRYAETTFILAMPVWYGYALGLIGAVLFVAVSLFTVWRSLNAVLRGGGRT